MISCNLFRQIRLLFLQALQYMKQLLSLVIAGFIGGGLAVLILQDNPVKTVIEENISPQAVLTSSNTATQPFDFVLAAEKALPSVVHITAEESKILAQERRQRGNDGQSPFGFFNFDELFGQDFYPKSGTGSGVILSEDGYIITNNHVVENADVITIMLSDGRKMEASKIGTDPSTDLAVLKIEADGLSPIGFSNSDQVKVGEWVAAVGNPFGYLESTVTAGIVSAIGRDIDIIKGEKAIEQFIQTDAAINPGNSGGALVNTDGDLIGINTAIATPTGVFAGYSFAIPANLVYKIFEDIKVNGDIQRARLGVLGETVTPELQEEKNFKTTSGFYIESIQPGSSAQLAGLLPRDIIIESNGSIVQGYEDIADIMEFAKVGDKIELKVIRKNKEIDIVVMLKKGI